MGDESTLLGVGKREEATSLKYMLKLAAPMVISTVSFTVMQFVDRLMVSRLGKDALAAVWPAAFVSFIPGGFAMGAMTSLNTFVSQCLGRGDKRACSNYFWQVIYMGFTYFVTVVVIMWPTAPVIFKAMGHPSEVVQMEVIYLRILLYAHILAIINWSANQFYMGIHRPIISMCASLCGQIVNVAANYVLIFGKFGFPRLEIAGAGWGTFIGIAVAAGINIAVFLSRRIDADFKSRRTLNIDFGKMVDVLKVGLPAGFGLMVNVAFWGVILSWLVGRVESGKEALAATGAVLSYTNLSVMPVVGMSMALTAAVGKSIGSRRKELAARHTRVCISIAMVYMGLVGICFFHFPHLLMRAWSDPPDAKVIEAGANILICAAVYQVFHAARVVYGGALRGAGDTMWLALVSGLGSVVILGAGGALMVKFFPSLDYMGPWIAATVSIIAVGLANFWRFRSNRWMKIDLFKRHVIEIPVQAGGVGE
jgi:MATE family multidrug resistance protein